jgi:hypothetical protein
LVAEDDHVGVADPDALTDWRRWWKKWDRRIQCLAGSALRAGRRGSRRRRVVRATDVTTAWLRSFWPAADPVYVMPEWSSALSPADRGSAPRPTPVLRPRKARPASERRPGASLDDVGPYFKLRDGTVYRDRRTAAHRLWRRLEGNVELQAIVDWLPGRVGSDGRHVRGRTPDRVLDALVCYGLVQAGMSQIGAARVVAGWSMGAERDAKKLASANRAIWEEMHLPRVSE